MPIDEEHDPLIAGKIDDKYHVLERLSTGGVASIYKAEELATAQMVRLKVFPPTELEGEERESFLAHFDRVAEILRSLDHPHTARLRDYGHVAGQGYLVFDFVTGRTLRKAIEDDGPFSTEQVGYLVNQISGAVSTAHSQGIIHGDLTSENIMLVSDDYGQDHALVLDFATGMLVTGGDVGVGLSQSGKIIGSPEYMSPEQVKGLNVGPQSDVYSLGIIVYEMFTGRVPFVRESPSAEAVMDLLMRQAQEPPASMRECNPSGNFSEEMDKLVLSALSKEPEERSQSIGDFADALTLLLPATSVQEEVPEAEQKHEEAATPYEESIWSELTEEMPDSLEEAPADDELFREPEEHEQLNEIVDDEFQSSGQSWKEVDWIQLIQEKKSLVIKVAGGLVVCLLLWIVFGSSGDEEAEHLAEIPGTGPGEILVQGEMSVQEEILGQGEEQVPVVPEEPVQAPMIPKVGVVNPQKIIIASLPGKHLRQEFSRIYREIKNSPDKDEKLAELRRVNKRVVDELVDELQRVIKRVAANQGYGIVVTKEDSLQSAVYIDRSLTNPGKVLAETENTEDISELVLVEFDKLYSGPTE